MTTKPKGGRGIKAPYTTTTIRVPLPVYSYVNTFIDEYRDAVINGLISDDENFKSLAGRLGYAELTQFEAVIEAKKILKSKKSAKMSLIKLLQVIYNDKSINFED